MELSKDEISALGSVVYLEASGGRLITSSNVENTKEVYHTRLHGKKFPLSVSRATLDRLLSPIWTYLKTPLPEDENWIDMGALRVAYT